MTNTWGVTTDVGLLEWIAPPVSDREPNPPLGYVVCFLLFLDRGFGTPAGRLIRATLHYYRVELHNLNPNSVMQAAVFITVCMGFLGVPAHWSLWLHLSRRRCPPATREGRRFPCGSAVARCSFARHGPTSTSRVSCPR